VVAERRRKGAGGEGVLAPAVPTAFDLRVVSLSDEADEADVAVVPVVPKAAGSDAASLLSHIPVFPVDAGQPSSASGQPIVLLGYPIGLDALLARLDEAVVRKVLDASGGDTERTSAELARLGQIRPLATQGHLSDVLPAPPKVPSRKPRKAPG
jgi:serine protease Do